MTVKFGNRVTEKDLREWLDRQGWAGRTARIEDLELHAIERPGWIQVFRFRTELLPLEVPNRDLPPASRKWFYGAILDDERNSRQATQVWMYDNVDQQTQQLERLSANRLVLQSGRSRSGLVVGLAILTAIAGLIAIVNWLT